MDHDLRHQHGLTLLEVLVVMALLAVVVGVAMLSVDLAGPERKAEDEARRLMALIDQHCDGAVLDGNEYGLRLEPDGYRFAQWEGESWGEYFDPPVFRPRLLPAGFRIALQLDGRDVLLEHDPESHDPHVVCFSSGEMTPFDIAVATPEGVSIGVAGAPDGQLELDGWSQP